MHKICTCGSRRACLLVPYILQTMRKNATAPHHSTARCIRRNTHYSSMYICLDTNDDELAHLSTASAPFTSPSAGAAPSCRTTSAAVSSTTSVRVTLAYRPATRQAFFAAAAEDPVDARSSMIITLQCEWASQIGIRHARDGMLRFADARVVLGLPANQHCSKARTGPGWKR